MFAPEGQAACILRVTGAACAMFGIATVAAATAPALAAVLKNLRLEDFVVFNDLFSFVIVTPIKVN
jgi:hypothetical protein